jgi:transcriptional regulator with GAF, ATPase, and Fis domain
MTDSAFHTPQAGLASSKLASLAELARVVGGSPEEASVQNAILVGSMALCDADYGSIQLFHQDGSGHVHLDRWEGSLEGDLALRCDALIAPWIAQHGVVFKSDDLSADARFSGQPEALVATSVLAAPIRRQADRIGALILARPVGQPFGDDDELLLSIVAELASTALFHIRHHRLIADENRRLRGKLIQEGGLAAFLGRSAAWEKVCTVLRNVGPSEARILLLGESGTGKEMCAKSAHDLSARKDRPFVAVNCAALPEALAESELFGYVKGAFTGAVSDRGGLFMEAHLGTLFLDEVGSASAGVQSSLLRAIQEGEIRPVGSTVPRKVDVRLICATSCDLEAMVKAGTFRKDLYYRINVVSITLPPLRERRDDISVLAYEFLRRITAKMGRGPLGLTPDTLVALEGYTWPGNVRELQNTIEHAVLFTPPDTDYVLPNALPARIFPEGSAPQIRSGEGWSLDRMLATFEREIVAQALDRCGWNQSEAARALGVSEKLIRNRIREFQLRRDSATREPGP